MAQEALIDENEIDATGGIAIEKSIKACESLADPKLMASKINYIIFDRYKVGFIEDENRKVLGISSIEIVKDFYQVDQLPQEDNYWDAADY